jgi:hypothetical protein
VWDWYSQNIAGTGRSGALWLLVGFVVAYSLTRWITVTIRRRAARGGGAGASPIKDVHIGGVHVHHQVWGILIVLVSGLLVIRFDPGSPWLEVASAAFGVGAALALDEFALWLHLEDVYWSEEGKKSLDAVMIAAVVVLVLLASTTPVGVERGEGDGLWPVTIALVFHLGFVVITALKGKMTTALVGLPMPLFSFVGALRLARPDSFWARRFYRKRPKKRERAQRRQARLLARRDRLRRLVSFGAA